MKLFSKKEENSERDTAKLKSIHTKTPNSVVHLQMYRCRDPLRRKTLYFLYRWLCSISKVKWSRFLRIKRNVLGCTQNNPNQERRWNCMVCLFLALNSKANVVVDMQVAPDSFTLFSDGKVVKKKRKITHKGSLCRKKNLWKHKKVLPDS